MGVWDRLSGLRTPKMPNARDIIEAPQQIKEETQKAEANIIYVKYFSRDGAFVADGIARIRRDTEYEIAHCRIPEPLGFVVLPGSM